MSLYADYINSHGLKSIIETDQGFITYKLLPPTECYIEDVYVVPEARKTGLAKSLIDQVSKIAKDSGIKYLSTAAISEYKEVETSISVILSLGFQVFRIDKDQIVFSKEL